MIKAPIIDTCNLNALNGVNDLIILTYYINEPRTIYINGRFYSIDNDGLHVNDTLCIPCDEIWILGNEATLYTNHGTSISATIRLTNQ